MNPNDTLNGRLLAYERPGEAHLRNSLGYWHMVETRMVAEEMRAEGLDPDDPRAIFEISRRISLNHAQDVPFSVSSRRPAAAAAPGLTREEWAFLASHFDGANDPLAASILAKARNVISPLDAPSARA